MNRRRDFRVALMFKIVKGKAAFEVEGTLLPADIRPRRNHQHKYKHL